MRKAKYHIIIADKAEIVRVGIEAILSQDDRLRIVDTAQDGEEALRKTLRLKPDILILGDDITRFNSQEILRRLYLAMCTTRVLLIGKEDQSTRRSALRLGAYGYLDLDATGSELCDVVRRIAQVERIETEENDEPILQATREMLSIREMEVLKCVTDGKSNQDIARTLYISEKTVKNHLSRIFRKMNVTDRTQAALTAIREKWIILE